MLGLAAEPRAEGMVEPLHARVSHAGQLRQDVRKVHGNDDIVLVARAGPRLQHQVAKRRPSAAEGFVGGQLAVGSDPASLHQFDGRHGVDPEVLELEDDKHLIDVFEGVADRLTLARGRGQQPEAAQMLNPAAEPAALTGLVHDEDGAERRFDRRVAVFDRLRSFRAHFGLIGPCPGDCKCRLAILNTTR